MKHKLQIYLVGDSRPIRLVLNDQQHAEFLEMMRSGRSDHFVVWQDDYPHNVMWEIKIGYVAAFCTTEETP